MTQPTNTYDSYDIVGDREGLIEKIYNISPSETPMLNSFGKSNATAVLHEWQTDALASPGDNKVIEGDDATTDAMTATTRLTNDCQISDKVVQVSGTVEVVKKAGRAKEMAFNLAKKSLELRTDMEYAICGINNAKVAGNSTTARELASMESWITTNTSAGSGGADPTGDGTDARTDGTQRVFTEDLLKTVCQAIYTAGGKPTVLSVGAFNKRVVSSFTGNATRTQDAMDKKLTATIDIYVYDFGSLRVVPNRIQRSRTAFVVDPSMWKIAYLRPFMQWPLAKTGDTERRQLLVEYTLEACNEASSGVVADLTTS